MLCKKRIAIISLSVIAAILLIVGGFFGGKYFQKTQLEKAGQEIELRNMQEALESGDIDLEELIVSEAGIGKLPAVNSEFKKSYR